MPSVFVIRGNKEHPELPVENLAGESVDSVTRTYIQIHNIKVEDVENLYVYDCNTATEHYPHLNNV